MEKEWKWEDKDQRYNPDNFGCGPSNAIMRLALISLLAVLTFFTRFSEPPIPQFICERCKNGKHTECVGETHCYCQHRERTKS